MSFFFLKFTALSLYCKHLNWSTWEQYTENAANLPISTFISYETRISHALLSASLSQNFPLESINKSGILIRINWFLSRMRQDSYFRKQVMTGENGGPRAIVILTQCSNDLLAPPSSFLCMMVARRERSCDNAIYFLLLLRRLKRWIHWMVEQNICVAMRWWGEDRRNFWLEQQLHY